MQHAYRAHAHVEADGQLTLKNLPFAAGEAVEIIVLSEAKDPADSPLQPQSQAEGEVDALAVLESLIGTVDAPSDWAEEHDHYLYGTPKRKDRQG
jgi:hypothetical protein